METSDNYFNKGVKAYNLWYKFINKEHYYELALDNFIKAKNLYIHQNNNDKVIECYDFIIKCCKNLYELNNKSYCEYIAKYFDEYAEYCAKNKLDIDKTVTLFKSAQHYFLLDNNTNKYNLINEKIGNLYYDTNNNEMALVFYQSFINQIDSNTNKIKYIRIIDKIIEILVIHNKYDDVSLMINHFVKVCRDENYLHTRVINKIICLLCCNLLLDENVKNTEKVLEEYSELLPFFSNSRHYSFVCHLIDTLKILDQNDYIKTIKDYDQVTPFDHVTINLLNKIRKKYFDESLC